VNSSRCIFGTTLLLTLSLLSCSAQSTDSSATSSSSLAPALLKTYTDTEHGFSLTYPATWILDKESTNRQLLGLDIIFYSNEFTSREGFRVEKAGRYGIQTPISKFEKNVVTGSKDITIGGKPGREVITTSAINPNAAGVRHLFVQHGDYYIQFQTSGPLMDKEVISSVKFTL
jgi:hypothetical protein